MDQFKVKGTSVYLDLDRLPNSSSLRYKNGFASKIPDIIFEVLYGLYTLRYVTKDENGNLQFLEKRDCKKGVFIKHFSVYLSSDLDKKRPLNSFQYIKETRTIDIDKDDIIYDYIMTTVVHYVVDVLKEVRNNLGLKLSDPLPGCFYNKVFDPAIPMASASKDIDVLSKLMYMIQTINYCLSRYVIIDLRTLQMDCYDDPKSLQRLNIFSDSELYKMLIQTPNVFCVQCETETLS